MEIVSEFNKTAKQGKSEVRVQVNDTQFVVQFFSLFSFYDLIVSLAAFIFYSKRRLDKNGANRLNLSNRPTASDFVFYNFPSAFGLFGAA